ncbi:MAG: hypothetical protein JWP41_4646, partial [Ramlibacter sp.]|nr:hypothetical protein [Ramlibacter sp.]
IFGDVLAYAPLVSVRAVEGPGFELPHHCREALSTSSGSPGAGNAARRGQGDDSSQGMQLPN